MKGRGFGTNFHKVYGSDALTYHTFSQAEHFSPELNRKVQSLLTGKILLDVAAGTCHKTNLFSKSFKKVYALDYSSQLLEFARITYKRNSKLIFLNSSATQIPLLDKSVDSILVTWGSFPLSRGIKEMKRVLKPGGVIVRIGAVVKDDFTILFPAFNQNRLKRINQTFKEHNFFIERYKVEIRFGSSREAKNILSKITGTRSSDIKHLKYQHDVALCYYIKE